MDDHDPPADHASQVIDAARAAEHATQHLCRTTLTRPSMTPAEVDLVLAHLAAAAAALPQTARQLGDILTHAREDHVLEMDTLTDTQDPDQAIDTARLHLDGVREPALTLYRLLDAAHNETAHIATADREAGHADQNAPGDTSGVRRPEEREPPPMGPGGTGPCLPR
jgi:hypothetical protein